MTLGLIEMRKRCSQKRIDCTGMQALTPANDDCRQPNWSPAGDAILYQKQLSGRWDIWLMDTDGGNRRQVNAGPGSETDASFSPSGNYIVYSSEVPNTDYANLYMPRIAEGAATRITSYCGYDGAPAWSPGGRVVAFESDAGDPDGSAAHPCG